MTVSNLVEELWRGDGLQYANTLVFDMTLAVTMLRRGTPAGGFSDVQTRLFKAESGLTCVAQIPPPGSLSGQAYGVQREKIEGLLDTCSVTATTKALREGIDSFRRFRTEGMIDTRTVIPRNINKADSAILYFDRKPFEEFFDSPEQFFTQYAAALLSFHKENDHAYWANDGK